MEHRISGSKVATPRSDFYPSVKNVEIDFGEVEVGVTHIKSIKVVNRSSEEQTYIVQRDPLSNTLDSVFQTVAYTWTLCPDESYVCNISYKPVLPNRKYIDYFFVTDTFECSYKIVVRGSCAGPKVSSSTVRLIFTCDNNSTDTQKCFKLINKSAVSTRFVFDFDPAQCPFKVNEVHGTVRPNAKKCMSVTFEPPRIGIYKYVLPCLVTNQDPVLIEIYGLYCCNLERKSIQAFHSRVEDLEELDDDDNFENYMRDITNAVKNDPPLFSLSSSYLDFGHAEVGIEKFSKRTPQTVCLTNHSIHDLFVLWDTDTSGVYSMTPEEAELRANQSIIFEVRFDPCEEQKFYCTDLTARLFRLPCCLTNFKTADELLSNVIPDFVSLRLIGHTHNYGHNDWMPQYEIPEAVTMPACVPASPAYTTFAIKNFGQQPLMFCFVPPIVTHYSLKPMAGLITQNQEQQVIGVQLFPEAENGRAYVERWAVRLNGSPSSEIYVDFQGFAEQPRLVFGEDDIVSFDPVHVGCEQSMQVPVRNLTRHSLRFDYLAQDFPEELHIEPLSGVVHPNETVYHQWRFMPTLVKEYDFGISCSAIAEKDSKCYTIGIGVSGSSSHGFLLAVPDVLSFGERVLGETCEMDFKIFNFSSVTIHYQLAHRHTKNIELMENLDNDIKISPLLDTISPGRSEKIKILFTPTQPGFYEVTIAYFLRSSSTSDMPIPSTKPHDLCTMTCTCYLPTIQIKDLIYLSERNKQISKVSLWKSLNLDGLNSAMKDLLPSQEASVEMIIPFADLDEGEKFTVKILLENTNSHEVVWHLKKRKTCLCNDQALKNKLTMKRSPGVGCFYCVHDDACIIRPRKICLQKNETAVLTLEIKNHTLHPEGIFWDLDIGGDRLIILNIRFESSIISSGPSLEFKIGYIQQCSYTYHKAIWLYNNCEFESKYLIETENLALVNRKNYGVILTCLNPEGTIDGYSRLPVLFGFCPNRFGKFSTTVLVTVGDQESSLCIEAESSCELTRISTSQDTCPLYDTFTCPEIHAYFNKDCIVLPLLSVHSRRTEIIMLHNHHAQDVFQYEWRSYEIPGVAKVDVEPSKGLIQPQTLLTFLVHVYAEGHECSLDIDVFCEFVNVSERRLFEKKKIEHTDIMRKTANDFIITEKGQASLQEKFPNEIKKPATFCKTLTLRILVLNSCELDQRVDLLHQLKNPPIPEMRSKSCSSRKNFSQNLLTEFSSIFECMIWDIINGKHFGRVLKQSLTAKHDLKYSQFPTDLITRKNQTRRSHWVPPKQFVENILHRMICMTVHEDFNLISAHFSHPPDVRQKSSRRNHNENWVRLSNEGYQEEAIKEICDP